MRGVQERILAWYATVLYITSQFDINVINHNVTNILNNFDIGYYFKQISLALQFPIQRWICGFLQSLVYTPLERGSCVHGCTSCSQTSTRNASKPEKRTFAFLHSFLGNHSGLNFTQPPALLGFERMINRVLFILRHKSRGITECVWSFSNPHCVRLQSCHPQIKDINCERYVQVILGKFFPELKKRRRLYGWFQQDSATANTARISMQALSDVFGTELAISSDIWPAHSSHLNPSEIVWSTKFTTIAPKQWKNWNETFVGKLQIFLQNNFKGSERLTPVRGMSACRVGQHFQHLWAFSTLSVVRHADSTGKFVCASRQESHWSPWSAEPWNQSTKLFRVSWWCRFVPCKLSAHAHHWVPADTNEQTLSVLFINMSHVVLRISYLSVLLCVTRAVQSNRRTTCWCVSADSHVVHEAHVRPVITAQEILQCLTALSPAAGHHSGVWKACKFCNFILFYFFKFLGMGGETESTWYVGH
jgi:hypothetical protein